MPTYTPYVYRVECVTTGQYYYGSKYAKTTPTHPDLFWKTYFTSSKSVLSLLEKHGPENWVHDILYVGKTPEEVLAVEDEYIAANINDELCLNASRPASAGCVFTHIAKARKIEGPDGLTSYQRGALKGVYTKRSTLVNGKNILQVAYDKALEDNPELHQIRKEKAHKTMSKVDPETGLNVYQKNGMRIRGDNNPSKNPENAKKISEAKKASHSENPDRMIVHNRKINQINDTPDENGLTNRDRHSEWMKKNNPASGSKWWNDGVRNVRVKSNETPPPGFVLGRTKRK